MSSTAVAPPGLLGADSTTGAAHLTRIVRRAGFGATGAELDAVRGLTPAAAVDLVLRAAAASDRAAVTPPTPQFETLPKVAKTASLEARGASRMHRRAQLQELTGWWLRRMVATDRPATEHLVFLWHNHFATAANKVRSASLLLGQNTTLRDRSMGDFGSLAHAMLVDPAMLVWLDGRQNTRTAPNENLSREFLELFALGHGNFTETDVREGARALTGWKVGKDGVARLRPAAHDPGSKTVLGVTGDLDAAGFCDAVLARPASARYVATRLWRQLASLDNPSPALLERLVGAYGPRRDLAALTRAILLAPEFATAAGTMVVSPVEWLVGALRALHLPVGDNTKQLLAVLRTLGQVPFYPPSVGGWPSGQAWLSTAAVTTRLTAARSLAATADLSELTALAQRSRVEAVTRQLGIPALTAGTAAVLRDAATSPQRLVALALNSPEYLTH